MYRRGPMPETHSEISYNAPSEVQFEGVEFSDGWVAVRWLTQFRSVSVWDCMADMLAIHGHPEYGSELVWKDASEGEILDQTHRDRWESEKEGDRV